MAETDFTYIEVVSEIKLNETELQETLEKIQNYFLPGTSKIDERFDGKYLVRRASGLESLSTFSHWVKDNRILDTVRKRLVRSMVGNITAVYFNRQAAAMHKLSLIDVDDNPPLGSIALQIVSDGLETVIDEITPRTHKGREVTKDEWEMIKIKKFQQKELRKDRYEKENYSE